MSAAAMLLGKPWAEAPPVQGGGITENTLLLVRVNPEGTGFLDVSPFSRALTPTNMTVGAVGSAWDGGQAMVHGSPGVIAYPVLGLNALEAWTVDAWLKTTTPSADQRMDYSSTVEGRCWTLRSLPSGGLSLFQASTYTNSLLTSNAAAPYIAANTWTHILAVYKADSDGTSVQLYVNGVPGSFASTANLATNYGSYNVRYWGRAKSNSPDYRWYGSSDEFRVTAGDATADPADPCYILPGNTGFVPPTVRYYA